MAGSKEAALKTARTNKAKYGMDYYKVIGAMGGRAVTSKPKGFAANRELARTVGAIGGSMSRIGKPPLPRPQVAEVPKQYGSYSSLFQKLKRLTKAN